MAESNRSYGTGSERDPQFARRGSGKAPARKFQDYFNTIRQWWLPALVLAAAAAGSYAYFKLQETPLYKSFATVAFEMDNEQIMPYQKPQANELQRAPEYSLTNHLMDLRSGKFRSRVIDTLTEEEQEIILEPYQDEDGEGPRLASVIARSNNIHQRSGHVFVFEFQHRAPEGARLLANRFAEVYEDFLMDRQRRGDESAIRFLRSQVEEMRRKVEAGELALQEYRQDRNLVSLEENQNLIVERMKSINNSLNAAKISFYQLESKINQMDKALERGEDLVKLPFIQNRPEISRRLDELKQLRTQRAMMAIKYGSQHPEMLRNAESTRILEAELSEAVDRAVSEMRENYRSEKATVEDLQKALATAEKESLDLDRTAIEYNVLKRKLEGDRTVFQQLHNRLNQTQVVSQLASPGMRVVDPAWVPSKPFTPDRDKIFVTAGMLFSLLFVGVPIGLDLMRGRLKTLPEVEQMLGIPFLGEVQKISGVKRKTLARVVIDKKLRVPYEMFRSIYTHLALNTVDRIPLTFVVTSTVPKEGKSFFSANIAACFSRHHHRVLLLDGDLRRPAQDKMFALPKDVGILPFLASGESPVLENHDMLGIYRVSESLDILPTGGHTDDATEILKSEKFEGLVNYLKTIYDVIVIDAPPAGVLPDPLCLGSFADYFIYVARPDFVRKSAVKSAVERLREADTKVAGLVFNMSNMAKSRRYGYAPHRYQYKYYSHYTTGRKSKDKDENKKDVTAS